MGSGTRRRVGNGLTPYSHNRLVRLAQMISAGARYPREYPAEHHHCAGAESYFP